MDFHTAFERLEQAGYKASVTVKNDVPIELLFWDDGLNGWNSWCLILEDETIPQDAADDVNELKG
jgi:hypothetical protein